MINLYILKESYCNVTLESFQENLVFINKVLSSESCRENFFISRDTYEYETIIGNFSQIIFSELPNEQFRINVLPRILSSITHIDESFVNEVQLDNYLTEQLNGFCGVKFGNLNLSEDRIVTNDNDLLNFNYSFTRLAKSIIWNNKSKLFKNLIFCKSCENEKDRILGLQSFTKIITSLINFEKTCVQNKFSDNSCMNDLRDLAGLDVSPETVSTLQNYKVERTFELPNKDYVVFNYHIKIDDIRIYYEIIKSGIYIGYIGGHLPTKKFKK